MSSAFAHCSAEDVRRVIADHPLAWVVPQGSAGAAGLLPLLGEYGEDGALIALIGHMSRRNPLVEAFSRDTRGAILFSGPQGYVSPSHAGLRNWGPTWNYVQIAIDCTIEMLPDFTEEAIDRLVAAMEPEGPDAWRSTELGERYPGMLRAIIGFRATVTSTTGRFKLGQDERPEVLRSILSTHPDAALVEWMRRMNEGRV